MLQRIGSTYLGSNSWGFSPPIVKKSVFCKEKEMEMLNMQAVF